MTRHFALALALVLPPAAAAQDPERIVKPEIRKGDSWTYRSNGIIGPGIDTYEIRVERSEGNTILVVATRKSDAKEFDATFTTDWSTVVGVSGLIMSPPPAFLAFPMSIGDARSISYTASRPRTDSPPTQYKNEVRVVGWEEVTVPAGQFRAMKVAVEGEFFPPPARNSAKMRITYWYVPDVRRWVKVQLDFPNVSAGEELLEYKLNEN